MLATSHADSPKDDLDWGEMEGLFCLNNNTMGAAAATGTAGGRGAAGAGGPGGCRGDMLDGGGGSADMRPRKENAEITLLDGKRCLNVNIFLKQFRA